MCTARARCYVRRMRVKRPVLDTALDAGFAVVGFGLTAVATWTSTSLTGTPLAGPPWLLAVLPLLIGGPLLLRRRAPLLMWVIVWVGISLQALATHLPPRAPSWCSCCARAATRWPRTPPWAARSLDWPSRRPA